MKQDVGTAMLLGINQVEKDNKFLKEALKEAKKAYLKEEVPIGCVIVVDDKIIARAHNKKVSNKSPLAHAEIIAIDKATKKLSRAILDDATIYITVEPCLMCAGAIFQARIKRVVFGVNEPKFGALGSLININELEKINHKVEISSGLLEEEISNLMKSFFQDLRKRRSV